MPIITDGGVKIETTIALPDTKVGKPVPFEFTGVNLNDYRIYCYPKPGCGCTSSQGEFEVGPGETFKVVGELEAQKKTLTYSKSINLRFTKVADRKDYENTIRLHFSGKIT